MSIIIIHGFPEFAKIISMYTFIGKFDDTL